ncbi:hypothetical protein NVS55_10475 [Myxococcus stipitatus]|uniref:hypothetical protein n=1 Tax=Myxococcus stipitatus TaxID=83455 RepID=UPI003145580A
MKNVVIPPSSGAAVHSDAQLNRRQILQWLGFGVVASSCGTLQLKPTLPSPQQTSVQLLAPDHAGPLTDTVLEALRETARMVSRFVGMDGKLNESMLETYLRLKCEERPSYLATYTNYAEQVRRPAQLSVAWLSELNELHRVKVVGELAIMSLLSEGFRAFGFGNFNGYMGGLWHAPRESGSFRASDEP